MPRSDWESKLICLQFDGRSEEIDEAFDAHLRAGRPKDTIIERLFSDYADTLRHACVDAANTPEEEDRAAAGELTTLMLSGNTCVHRFRERLLTISDQELAALYRETWKTNFTNRTAGAEKSGRRRDAFEFFNEPEADADYGFWLKVEAWTIDEAVALSLGKNPEIVNSKTLAAEASQGSSPFRDEFRKRTFLLECTQKSGLIEERLRRDEVIQWISANDIATPPELSNNNKDYDLNYWKVRCLYIEEQLNKSLSHRSDDAWDTKGKTKKSTIFRLLLGMAFCAYGHRLGNTSPAPLAIERDLGLLREQSEDDLKIAVGDDKIRIILEEAADLLSASWRGNLDLSVFEAWKQKNRGR